MNRLIKHVDLLVIKAQLGPFFFTFFVVLFVFIMQFFWIHIDDFVGKGLEWYVVAEIVLYLSANTVPLALPLAILLSSLMSFSNMGERYELTALKASGISLWRFMRGLMIMVGFISIGSLLFNNSVVPSANMKFYQLLHDITKTKPAFNIVPGAYYRDFDDFILKIGKKSEDDKFIYDIFIRELDNTYKQENCITAKSGEMFSANDGQYLVLKLYDGVRTQVMAKDRTKPEQPHMRTYFKEMEKVIDLSVLEMQESGGDLFKGAYIMLNIPQLVGYVDSMNNVRESILDRLETSNRRYFHVIKDSSFLTGDIYAKYDTSVWDKMAIQTEYEKIQLNRVYSRAASAAKNVKDNIEHIAVQRFKNNRRLTAKAQAELHKKFSLAVACIVLTLIGAPLGAIIRKGGIGFPLIISVLLYLLFMVMSRLCEELMEKHILNIWLAMWGPTLVMLPIGVFLTYKAMNDSSIMISDNYLKFFNKLLGLLQRF